MQTRGDADLGRHPRLPGQQGRDHLLHPQAGVQDVQVAALPVDERLLVVGRPVRQRVIPQPRSAVTIPRSARSRLPSYSACSPCSSSGASISAQRLGGAVELSSPACRSIRPRPDPRPADAARRQVAGAASVDLASSAPGSPVACSSPAVRRRRSPHAPRNVGRRARAPALSSQQSPALSTPSV